ncbi:MAG: hypothetical protein J0I86_19155, partial [Mesorhizobium sp.]|nr:hypothetical protein [Mesorhizobium sp.]
ANSRQALGNAFTGLLRCLALTRPRLETTCRLASAAKITTGTFSAFRAGLPIFAWTVWLGETIPLFERPAFRARSLAEGSIGLSVAFTRPVITLEVALRSFSAFGAALPLFAWTIRFREGFALFERPAFGPRPLAERSLAPCFAFARFVVAFEITLWAVAISCPVGPFGERSFLAGKGWLAGFAVGSLAASKASRFCAGLALEFVVVAHVVFARLRG